jgi:short-subunit dehydrogenase
VVVVTGAANGIGRATALHLAGEGVALELADIEERGLAAVLAALGPTARAAQVTADVRDPAAVEALERHAAQTWGRVDAVVNCAGVIAPGALDTSPAGDVARQVDTNLMGTIHVARAFLPLFRRQGSGHLVLMASLAGMVPIPGESVYAATKFAVRGLALSLDLELRGTGIRVTAVCPDSARTAMLDIEARDDSSSLSFSSRPMEPEVVARAIAGALRRPRREVTVPGPRGRLIRQVGAMTGLFAVAYPLVDWLARRRKAAYRRGMRDGS